METDAPECAPQSKEERMLRRRRRLGIAAVLLALAGTGCATGLPPIKTEAPLGRVVVYRNGVSYFERNAWVTDGKLELRVPSARIDDFLKSLTVVDAQTGETLPISYPTVDAQSGEATITIQLPAGKARKLRISYVTESPAWKPSYRLELGDGKQAKLQGWAIVDNVSGEDWKRVQVGVGATSALSFRYDLHSVREVERVTLTDDTALAAAPPTGGSPYAVAAERQKLVVGRFRADDLAELGVEGEADEERWAANAPHQAAPPPPPMAKRGGSGGGRGPAAVQGVPPQEMRAGLGAKGKERKKAESGRGRQQVASLAGQLKAGAHKVRIEGYAQPGDKDLRQASLDRANMLRDQLVANGVAADRIEAVGTGLMNATEAVRIVSGGDDVTILAQAKQPDGKAPGGEAPAVDQPLGSAHFVSKTAMTLEKDHSAMVSILNAAAEAQRVYFYDPISPRGSKTFAFNAVRFVNPSEYTLESGPFTVYAASQFLGEGLSEPILPRAVAFIPYALDRAVLVDETSDTREEIDKLLTIQRGIVTTETRRIRRTKLVLSNRGQEPAEVYVRHAVGRGYELAGELAKAEKLAGAHLFRVAVGAGKATDLVIEEWTPIRKTVDLNTADGGRQIALFLKTGKLTGELKKKLDEVVRRYNDMADLEERIRVLDDQMSVYRTRVDEINVQLVTLRKVTQAGRLQQHLAKKMEEISDRLQKATIEMTDMQGKIMTLRVELQDAVSDLTLAREEDKPAAASPPAAAS
jgi:hypothetical protein